MTDCIFCKIIHGEIPSYKIYEDEKVYAFLDLSQTTKGHTLVIPKQHVTDIFGYDTTLAGDVFARVPKIAQALEKALPEMSGLNVVNNNREMGGQTVFHSHIHLIPRYSAEDDFTLHLGNHQADYSSEALTALADSIQKQVTPHE